MKKVDLIFYLFTGLTIAAFTSVNFPRADISNGLIQARLYLPDSKQGYYRGTRFDWSGVIASLRYKGHQYFGQWFDTYNPTSMMPSPAPSKHLYP